MELIAFLILVFITVTIAIILGDIISKWCSRDPETTTHEFTESPRQVRDVIHELQQLSDLNNNMGIEPTDYISVRNMLVR